MHPKSGSNAVYEETAALLDWGFAHGGSAQPVGTLVEPLSEGGARATPTRRTAQAAAGAPGTASADPSAWRLLEGAGGTVALLAGGVWALRRRRKRGRHAS
jgi:D-alanyl-D-alanine carboxypeptidase (penicillin-binding protein 5/6)